MDTVATEFNQKILNHFTNPRNVGEIKNADGYAKVGDPNCGDYIKVWITIKEDRITDFKYKVFGCWGAISTTSVTSELAIGKSLKDAIKLTDDDVIKELGGIPENKQHCSLLGIQGLRTALADFLVKKNHKKYVARIELYRSHGYDIPKLREKMVLHLNDLPEDASILDVGAGKGHLSLAITRTGKKCTAVDNSSEEIYYARLNAIYYAFDDLIDFQEQDARQLKFDSDSFDAILSSAFFHHVIHPELVLDEMLRVCKSQGRILISDLNENGQQILNTAKKKEGKEHVMVGWPLEKIKKWFENKKFETKLLHENCEDILIVFI
jgi:nitrogen fixation protein NifU and related proteins